MKHQIGARLGAFEQQTSNLRCLRHTTTSNNLLYMLKTSFKSFYYIFCSKLILDLIYIFLGRLSMSPGGPPARSRWLGPKRADKIVGQKRRTTGFEPQPQGRRACALPLYYSIISVLCRKIKVYIIIMEGPWYTGSASSSQSTGSASSSPYC